MSSDDELKHQIERQARRIRKAERERSTLLAQTVYAGTLGLLFVLPVVAGAYLGRWADELSLAYSSRWTVSGIVLGLIIGAMNVYFFIKE